MHIKQVVNFIGSKQAVCKISPVEKVFWGGRKEVWLATKFAPGFKYWPTVVCRKGKRLVF